VPFAFQVLIRRGHSLNRQTLGISRGRSRSSSRTRSGLGLAHPPGVTAARLMALVIDKD
jgi:hypothetical protein